MGGKDAPAAPDYSQLAMASERAAELSAGVAMEQLDWAREQYDLNRDLLNDVLGIQMPIAVEQWENAKADRARYEEKFQPIEDDLVEEFASYGTDERKHMEVGRAMADMARVQDAQREQALQRLEGYGIDPSQTRSAALDANLRSQEAAAMAGAGNEARGRVENISRALRAEAINIGKGMPSQVAQSYGQAISAPSAAMSAANQTYATGAGAMGNPNQWMNTAQSGYGNAANIMNTGYQNQLAGWQAGQQSSSDLMGGLGTAAGMFMGGPAGGVIAGKLFSQAEGGAINVDEAFEGRTFDQDGEVIGPGGPKDDAVPAALSDGEYVIPYEVVHRKGTEFFDKLIEKTHGDMDQRAKSGDPKSPRAMQKTPQGPMALAYGGGVQRYAEGGAVPAPGSRASDVLPRDPAPQPPPPAISYQGTDSWRQHAAQPVHHQAPAPAPVPAPAPAPAQPPPAALPPGRTPAMQAILDKYSGGGGPQRTASGPREGGRMEGESIGDYFSRKYGIGGGRAQPTVGALPDMQGRDYYDLMQKDYQAMRQADPIAKLRMRRLSSPEDQAYYDYLKRTYGPQQAVPYTGREGG